jgi:hypothetical protein
VPGWLRREYVILLGVTFLWGSGHTAAKVVGGVALSQLSDVALLRRGHPVRIPDSQPIK